MSDSAYADIRARRMWQHRSPGVRSRERGRWRELGLRHAGVATAPAKKTLAGSAAQVGEGLEATLTCVKQHPAAHEVSMKGTGMVEAPAAQYFAPRASPPRAADMRE